MEVIVVIVLALLGAFVVYAIHIWWTNRKQPEKTYVAPLNRRWGTARTLSEKVDKSRWLADFEALDEGRRLERERVERGRADRAREWAERARLRAERRERIQREAAHLVADYEQFERENARPGRPTPARARQDPAPAETRREPAEVFDRLRTKLDSL